MATMLCIQACRKGEPDSLKFKLCTNCDFEPGLVIVARQSGLSISDTGVTTGIFTQRQPKGVHRMFSKRKFPVCGNYEEKNARV